MQQPSTTNIYVSDCKSETTEKTSSDWLFLNAWYKNTIDYKLIVKDSIVVDSMQILDILSIVDSLKIREIHPIGNNCMEVYIKDNSHPVVFSLD